MKQSTIRSSTVCTVIALCLLAGSAAQADRSVPVPEKIAPSLAAGLEANKELREVAVWVFFADKGDLALGNGASKVSDRAERRRARAGYIPGEGDIPLFNPYVNAVEEIAGEVRTRTKWLNGVSVETDRAGIDAISALPFVREIRAVGKRPPRAEPAPADALPVERQGKAADDSLTYGLTTEQLAQIKVPPLHNAGLSGAGVHVLMLDSGFETTAAPFAGMDIADRYDFVHDDTLVNDESGEAGHENHGTATLSTIGGYEEGIYVGPAYNATFYLGKTEDDANEYQQEEDFWVAGIAWGESLGVDVVSSSLGYLDWYTYEDMDGETAVTTLGAREAIRRGVIVVNSQGNEAQFPWHYMIAPADGDSVLSIGAVGLSGNRSGFSSFGPTFDGRIKPDVCALGSAVSLVTRPNDLDSPYGSFSGTSFSCPLTAGVVALMLEAHPWMTVHDLFPAIKMTASQAESPDTSLGWGIVNAFDAVTSLIVDHEPPDSSEWADGGYPGVVDLSLPAGFDMPVVVYDDGLATDTTTLEPAGGLPGKFADYTFTIPAPQGAEVTYYFAGTSGGGPWTDPVGAPSDPYRIEGEETAPPGFAFYYRDDEIGKPFNPIDRGQRIATTFFYDLPGRRDVSLRIYAPSGRLVRELINGSRPAGEGQSAVWNLKNEGGEDVTAGVYFILFEAGEFETKRTLVIL